MHRYGVKVDLLTSQELSAKYTKVCWCHGRKSFDYYNIIDYYYKIKACNHPLSLFTCKV